MNEENYDSLLTEITENKKVKQRIAYESPFWFSLLYLQHHFTEPLAPFHIELFHLLEQNNHDLVAVMAFRESGKSTICNLCNVLWSVLGKPKKKFVVIVSETQEQAKSHFANIKAELEENELLREDFGPFNEEKFNKLSLELIYHGAKIMSVTRGQHIRGLKYGRYRPDLIICDDLEDTTSDEDPEVLYERFKNEIIPIGSKGTKIIVLGNLISEDSFMMQLKDDIIELGGLFRVYPFLDDCKEILWKEKFHDEESVMNLRSKLSYDTWKREYLLDISTLWPTDGEDWSNQKEQIPLVRQMKKFKISGPFVGSFEEPKLGDPRYDKYQAYLKKLEIRGLEFRRQKHKEIVAEIRRIASAEKSD